MYAREPADGGSRTPGFRGYLSLTFRVTDAERSLGVQVRRSARYSASAPTPDRRPDLKVYIQWRPRKYRPGIEVTPRC